MGRLLLAAISPLTLLSSTLIPLIPPTVAHSQPENASLRPSAASESLPACAVACPSLQQVESHCVEQNEDAAVACFCRSGLMRQLQRRPDVCAGCSAASDRDLLRAWMEKYCSETEDVGYGFKESLHAHTQAKLVPRAGSDWWSTHYQWIIMVIVLIIAFTILTILGVWLKRRHDAKYPHLYHATSSRTSSVLLLNQQRQSQQQLTPTLSAAQPGSHPSHYSQAEQPGAFDPTIGMSQPRRFEGAESRFVCE